MEYTKFTYKEFFELAESKKLVLPNFQRDFVWKMDAQKQLLASFLVNLPVGTFLILEGDGGEFVSKELCFLDRSIETSSSCYYLLDGQQRLSTLKSIFYNHLNLRDWKKNINDLHYQLKTKWFLKVNLGMKEGAEEHEHDEDILGYKNLRFKVTVTDDQGRTTNVPKPLTLEPMDVIDYIVVHKVYKTSGKDKFFHPATDLGAGSDFDKRLAFSLKCAEKNLIPLFDLTSDDLVIIKNTLKTIADFRVQSLEKEVQEDVSKSEFYLKHFDDGIKAKYDKHKYVEIQRLWSQLKERWVEDILDYFKDLFRAEIMVPTVKANELARATSVFEYMNKGGTPLDTFDIIVAKFAGAGQQKTLYDLLNKGLTQNIVIAPILSGISNSIDYSPENFEIFTNGRLTKSIKEQFLNILSILNVKNSKNKGIKRISLSNIKKQNILSLKKEEIEREIEGSIKGLYRSLAFLQFRCGFFNYNRLSYKLMILPLAIILSEDENWENKVVLDRLEYWYWSSLFSGRYREKQNQRVVEDIKELHNWLVLGETESPIINRIDSVFKETNYCDKGTLLLKSLDHSVPTAIHNGILQYILSLNPADFTEEPTKLRAWEVSLDKISLQDHHIIPLGSVTTLGQSSQEIRKNKNHILNSPLNRTLITPIANNRIRAMNIEKYLPILNNSIYHSHCMPSLPEDKNELNDNNYENFLIKRFEFIELSLKQELESLRE